MGYQTVTIGGDKGNSDSEAKLERLQLPDLAGKSFLDLGCNMGFFCRVAKERGATYVVGVDDKKRSIDEAKARDPEGEYLAMDWFKALRRIKEQFDVIIHTSAFHYVTDHWDFLQLVEQRLKPGGLFILECGMVRSHVARYHDVRRTAFVKHVTSALLDRLLSRFEVRNMGRSVDQKGDPVPRHVFHCFRWKPAVMIVGGASGSGKSSLAKSLATGNEVTRLGTDEMIPALQHCPNPPVANLMQEYFGSGKGLARIGAAITEAGLVDEFATSLAELVPNCFRVVVLEGQIFKDERFRQAIANKLTDKGFICWEGERLMPQGAPQADLANTKLLVPNEAIKLQSKVAADRFVRTKPIDNEMMMIVNGAEPPTQICWSVPPDSGNRFESFVRVHQHSKPIRITIEAANAAETNEADFFQNFRPLSSNTQDIEGADRYTPVRLDLPKTSGNVLVRVTVEMANRKDPTTAARVFIGSPQIMKAG